MASREPQRPEIDANRRREPLKRINLSGQLALMGETRRFRPFFRKLINHCLTVSWSAISSLRSLLFVVTGFHVVRQLQSLLPPISS
jgi:hypothetical protein